MSRQNWATPQAFFDKCERRFGKFDLDACASAENAKCSEFYDEEANGLKKPWFGSVWCNPPYDNIKEWVWYAIDHRMVCDRIVMLLPARLDQGWYHAALSFGARMVPIKGRVQFVPPPGIEKSSNPAASMLLIFEQPLSAK